MKTIDGYCYATHAPVSLTRQEWQARIIKATRAGGWRRVEDGETFIHLKGGKLTAEIYANVAVYSEPITTT